MGVQTLQPGGLIPVHRHLSRDSVVFVHKGQGRVTLEGRTMTVVPGMTVSVPRRAWYGLRNTGTGLFQVVWVSAPAGVEEFFREFSRLGESPAASAFQAAAQRHGIELRVGPEAPEAAGPQAPGRRHRRQHRGGRKPGGASSQPSQSVAQPSHAQPAAAAPSPRLEPAAPAAQPGAAERPRRRRRRHRGRGGRGRPSAGGSPVAPSASTPIQAPGTGSQRAAGGAAGPAPSRPGGGRPAHAPRPRREGQRPRRGRIKEVYMGGRWVQVTGEGPVISPGRERPPPGKRQRDEDSPGGPLSVPL